jgi:hypothetical protein
MKPGDKITGFLRMAHQEPPPEANAQQGGAIKITPAVSPFVKVALASDPTWKASSPDDLPPLKTLETAIALVDTGANLCAIDEELVTKLRLPIIGQVQTDFAGSLQVAQIVFVQICFVSQKHVAGKYVQSRSLRASGDNFDVILGTDFLRSFDIRVSEQGNLVELTYLGSLDK